MNQASTDIGAYFESWSRAAVHPKSPADPRIQVRPPHLRRGDELLPAPDLHVQGQPGPAKE